MLIFPKSANPNPSLQIHLSNFLSLFAFGCSTSPLISAYKPSPPHVPQWVPYFNKWHHPPSHPRNRPTCILFLISLLPLLSVIIGRLILGILSNVFTSSYSHCLFSRSKILSPFFSVFTVTTPS